MNKWWGKHGQLVQWISSLTVLLIGSFIIFLFTKKYEEYVKMKEDLLKKPNIEDVKSWDKEIVDYVKEKDTQLKEDVNKKVDKDQFDQILEKLNKMDDRIYQLWSKNK